MRFILAFALLLVLVAPLTATGWWTETAPVTAIETVTDASGTYVATVVADSGSGNHVLVCNTDAREEPAQCGGVTVGNTYTFSGSFSVVNGAVTLRVLDIGPADVAVAE